MAKSDYPESMALNLKARITQYVVSDPLFIVSEQIDKDIALAKQLRFNICGV